MKIAVDFPSIVFREGPQRVLDLARAVEDLGYDCWWPSRSRRWTRCRAGACGSASSIGMQLMLAPPPRTDADRGFYKDLDLIGERAAIVAAMGFDWASVNVTAIFQAGARSVDAMIERLGEILERIRAEVG
ncbi:hypothetical protein [Candidatus Poriferisodalis sp.]|uniref:hypothetical protein n=1 Tax=Candidatus Poriferisodalis sp. TaxID=3101277 RepID=UPI003B58D43F